MSSRVVITGIGPCTPVGCGVDEFWTDLVAGSSGIGPITLFNANSLPVRIGGEVKGVDCKSLLNIFPGAEGEKDRKIWLGLDAASRAVQDSGLSQKEMEQSLLFVGVSLEVFLLDSIGSVAQSENFSLAASRRKLEERAGERLQTPLDQLTQMLADYYNMESGCFTNCSACAAGAQAVGEAFHRLRRQEADIALAGATDSTIHPLGLGGFSLLRILSEENESPQKACRPFDVTRQGTVLSEGSAFLILENLEHALGRGARIYAEVVGYASSLDAYRVTDPAPDGRGAVLSMSKAIADAGLTPEDIDGINAHGTGTLKNDIAETVAIKTVLGEHACKIPVTANKSMTGHMIATSGAAEAAASALSLFHRKFPPTINLEHPDPHCDLDYVPQAARDFHGRVVLSNSFGFGGQNASLIFRRYDAIR